ncbi:ABC transporter G family member 37 [Camellia lanceoleosa]|uniref:ABC transporter G family member 37 n=1 Tax=Camellia lanceoleosa TaxID=1840588 RepID=A0ACC0F6P6_9ERIC|nr:ABC transporter G family member 37 [Camellia lanceoleosa]
MFLLEEKLVAQLKEILELEGFPRFRRHLLGFWVTEFVKEVLKIIELDEIKDCLVGMPSVTEQRKWLTISVELIANPSIIFMDEPTTRLDARAAAIVIRAMKNVAETGRILVFSMTWISSILLLFQILTWKPWKARA